jgi:hypothetical protein
MWPEQLTKAGGRSGALACRNSCFLLPCDNVGTSFTRYRETLKKFIFVCALLIGGIGSAQAQVYFGSGSDRPINPGAARRALDRQERVRPPVRARQQRVRCGDGSRRVARLCRRHGGVAHR